LAISPYTPEQLDQVALRLLDICAKLRSIAQESRSQGSAEIPVHDKKALEWIGKLEQWAAKSQRDFELAQFRQRGAQAASTAIEWPDKPVS
jgi:hypothetical protein